MSGYLKADVDGRAAEVDEAAEVVAGAADRLLVALASARADDVERAAVEADEAGDVADDGTKTEGTKGGTGIRRLLDGVAALSRAGVALAANVKAGRAGDGEGSEGEDSEGAGVHSD